MTKDVKTTKKKVFMAILAGKRKDEAKASHSGSKADAFDRSWADGMDLTPDKDDLV